MIRHAPVVVAVVVLLLAEGVPGEAGFAPKVNYPAGQGPDSVAVADFNRDGRPDLAVVTFFGNTVSVLLGNGDGTFQPRVDQPAGRFSQAVGVGDFNGDAAPDLVVTVGYPDTQVVILLGNGNGTFQPAVGYSTGDSPVAVAVEDFDRDGRQDVAVVNAGSASVSIFLGNGNGTLRAAVDYGVGTRPYSIAACDFDGDGKPDLAVANSDSESVSILLGNGNGTFQAAVDYRVEPRPLSLAVSDFNRDGNPDLVIRSSLGTSSLSVLLGVGNGTFQAAGSFVVEDYAAWVVPGDFDGDGRPDLAVANVSSNRVSILRGKGDGRFQAAVSYPAGEQPVALAVGDLDGNGQLDLVAATYDAVSVLLNDASGAACGDGTAVPFTTGTGPSSVVVNDFDRDGVGDLAVPNSFSNNVSLLLGNGNGTFQGKMDYGVGSSPRAVAAGDFDRDGKPDLAVGNSGSDTVSILRGNGDGTFPAPVDYAVDSPVGIAVSDFNRDGKQDLAVANGALASGVSILLGNGAGGFASAGFYGTSSLANAVVVADFNEDGKADLAVSTFDPATVAILLGNGDGTFQPRVDSLPGGHPRSVAVGDFNRDGRPDLAVATFDSNSVAILLGNGDGTFQTAVPYSSGTSATGVAVADLDRDGREDLAVANSGSGEISVLAGVGDGTFQAAVNYVATAPLAVAVGDFNRDGTPDLVSPSNTSAEVSVLLGTCRFPSATTVSTYVNPAPPGFRSTYTARVTSGFGRPKGSVTFRDGTTILGTAALTAGAASLTPPPLASGRHTITAEYSGAARFFPSSGALTQIVNPRISVDDVRITEGNSVTSQAIFVVRLLDPMAEALTLDYQTLDGSATAFSDYLPASGTVTFLPGVTEREVSVSVLGDVTPEPNEAFFLRVSNVKLFIFVVPAVQATIVDDDTTGRVPRFQASWQGFFAVNPLETPNVGDFDGDGRTDIITFSRGNPLALGDVYVSLSTGTSFGPGVQWHDSFAIDPGEQVLIGDFDGDGKDDIASWLALTTRQVHVALSLGTRMARERVWKNRIGFDPSDVLAAGDVNGDGRDDLVLFARTRGKVYVALSSGVDFGPRRVWHDFFAVSTYERPMVADVNGDGKADIVTFASDSPTAFGDVYVALSDGTKFGDGQSSDKWHDFFAVRPTEVVRTGDLDGDGKVDFFTFLPPPFAQCYTSLSTGTTMGPSVPWPEPVSPDPSDKSFVGDANGDGLADIITFAQAEGMVYVSLAP